MQLHPGMRDEELHNQKKSLFLDKIKRPGGATRPSASPAQAAGNGAQVAALEEEIRKLTAENKALQAAVAAPKQTHSLNLKSWPTLGYWNIRGLGAQVRYLLYFCGVEFEDKMFAAGPAPDFDRSQWLDVKFSLGLDFPNLPYLIDEGVKLTETMAIMKYICAKWKPELLGATPDAVGHVEMMSHYVMKLKETATIPCYTGKSN